GFSPAVTLLLGNADGSLRSPVTFNPSFQFGEERWLGGDVNGDGNLDLISVGNQTLFTSPPTLGSTAVVEVVLGSGNGTFQTSHVALTLPTNQGLLDRRVGDGSQTAVAGDFNGDGKLDLAVVTNTYDSNGNVVQTYASVLLGNGDGTFQAAANY